jgi:bacterioferritin-associated ferredoxin
MLVCHCRAVNDEYIIDAIRRGAACLEQVGEHCGAGTQCGGCHVVIEELLNVNAPSGALAA